MHQIHTPEEARTEAEQIAAYPEPARAGSLPVITAYVMTEHCAQCTVLAGRLDAAGATVEACDGHLRYVYVDRMDPEEVTGLKERLSIMSTPSVLVEKPSGGQYLVKDVTGWRRLIDEAAGIARTLADQQS